MAEDNLSSVFNNFKNILNNSNSAKSNSHTNTSNQDTNNFNITPEMINNLANILQNNSSDNSQDNSQGKNASFNDSDSSAFNSSNIDFETIMKIKSIMDTLNKKDDPRSNLLYSLKPYLRESRRKKLDQYVNLFKITQVTNLFKNEKGDKS